MPSIAVIVPAAGNSSRFGGNEKKPYVALDGRPVWQRTCELFWNRQDVAGVFLVVNPGDREDFLERYRHVIAFANVKVIAGGTERFESVANALAVVPAEVDLVAVHDAVRPLTPPPLLDAVFAAAAEHGAAMLAIPLADTLKRVDPKTSLVTETVPRAALWQAQTPQVARRDWLVEAYARRASLPGPITDDAQLLEAVGRAVRIVDGSPVNFKITTKDDLELASAVLKARAESKPSPKAVHRFGDEAQW